MKFGLWTVPKVKKAFQNDETDRANEIFGRAVLGDHWFELLSKDRYEQVISNHSSIKAFWFRNEFPSLPIIELKALETPTLLLTGKDSPKFLIALSRKLGSILPNVKTKCIEKASHLMHEDNASAVNDAVRDFIFDL